MGVNTRNVLASRFHAVGLRPEEYMPLVRAIETWVKCSGEEWTVGRLKSLRRMFLALNNHSSVSPKDWIARRASGTMRVAGPFGVLERLPRKRFCAAWNALMCYTHFRSERVTSRQWEKFRSGVRRAPVTRDALQEATYYTERGAEIIRSYHSSLPRCAPTGDALLEYEPKDSLRAPLPSGSVPDVQGVLDSLWWLVATPAMMARHKGILSGTLKGVEQLALALYQSVQQRGQPFYRTIRCGRIAVIQEPGYKARFIANPARVWQQALSPLFRWTVALNTGVPGNWQFDQDGGRARAQELLRKYGYAYSLDLSGASDVMPRQLTFCLWKRLGLPEPWLALYADILDGLWVLPEDGRFPLEETPVRGYLSWTVGQPLGLKPTFNGFTGAHLALCLGISERAAPKGVPYEDLFVMCGDDIVWFDRECALLYRDVLSRLDVPVSEEKSLESENYAEFTSRLISRDAIYAAYKWGGFGDDSFMDLARQLGPRVMALLRPRQRRVVQALASVPEPWGLGWNPEGLSFYDRAEWFLNLAQTLRPAKLRTAGEHLARLYYESAMPVMAGPWIDPSPSSDQDEVAVMEAVFGPTGRLAWLFRDHFAVVVQGLLDILSKRSKGKDVWSAQNVVPPVLWESLLPLIREWGEEQVLRAWLSAVRRCYTFYQRNPTNLKFSKLIELEGVVAQYRAWSLKQAR